MKRERLYMIHGTGPDRVGLVGTVTTAVAEAGGNIVDLRQDVLHGLFTIFMVVDLSATELRADDLKKTVKALSEDTGLELSVEKYSPVARNPEKRTMLVILIGADKPGIIASVSESLGKYDVNIEFAQNVAREDVFLMELLVDISHCTIPLANVQKTIEDTMGAMGIRAIFQTEDVFNKRKRVVLFQPGASLMDDATRREIAGQAGLDETEPDGDTPKRLRAAAAGLESLPADVLKTIVEGVHGTAETVELLQTLKIMGYKIGLLTTGFTPVVKGIRDTLGIDHAVGVGLVSDDDSRALTGELAADAFDALDTERAIAAVVEAEGVTRDDVTVVTGTRGIRLSFDLSTLLDLYNKKSVSSDNLRGLLDSFGV